MILALWSLWLFHKNSDMILAKMFKCIPVGHSTWAVAHMRMPHFIQFRCARVTVWGESRFSSFLLGEYMVYYPWSRGERMGTIFKIYRKVQEFHSRASNLDDIYLEHITGYNTYVITVASILTLVMECVMLLRLLISHPAIDTPASRVYLVFYLSLILVATLYLVIQRKFLESVEKTYWLQFIFVVCYLLWNVLLNSYDLYRNERGSSLALVTAIIFGSILIHFRPQHMMILQSITYLLFYMVNYNRIEDKINATIAVIVAVVVNLLFYVRDIQNVHNRQQLTQVNAHLEKEQLDGAMQYLRRLQETQTQTSIYHHDLRHTLNLAEQLAIQGNLEKLQSFLSSSRDSMEHLPTTFYCAHETVNLVLGSFSQRSAEKKVAFETEVQLPKELPLADTELCSILSNLLENALKGAEQVEEEALRRIHIKALVRGEQLVILVENGYAGQILLKNGLPVSRNPEKHHGFGIHSIVNITERHHGFYAFETEGWLFRAKILLHLQKGDVS